MKQIELTKGQYAIVDDEDYEWLSQWKWYANVHHSDGFYAARNIRDGDRRTTLRMHRFIMDAPDGIEVDHEDGNKLNNRRSNLRMATRSQQAHNKRKQRGDSASRYKGVTWKNEQWRARIAVNGKQVHLGYYATPEEAALAYNGAAILCHRSFAVLNEVAA